jgi:hypothetical protein
MDRKEGARREGLGYNTEINWGGSEETGFQAVDDMPP